MNIKILTVTWSHEATYNIEKTTLYKSFKRFNPHRDIIHHHFNRGHFWQEERDFSNRFGRESEYLLYKIFLWRDIVREVESDYIIFCDANDVVCLGDVGQLINEFDLENQIIVGHEKNQWPTMEAKSTWPDYRDYNIYDTQERKFLNSGMILAKKDKYVELLDSMVNNVMSKNITTFNNDQGVFTYYYNTGVEPKIKLDYSNKFVVNTFSRSHDEYYMEGNRIVSKKNGTKSLRFNLRPAALLTRLNALNTFSSGSKYPCEIIEVPISSIHSGKSLPFTHLLVSTFNLLICCFYKSLQSAVDFE